MFENRPKSLIQHRERSELRLHIVRTKVHQKGQNCPIWQVFENETFLKIFKQCALVWRRTPTTYLLGKSLVICIGSNLQFWLKRSNFTCQFLLIALKKYLEKYYSKMYEKNLSLFSLLTYLLKYCHWFSYQLWSAGKEPWAWMKHLLKETLADWLHRL